MSPPPPPVIVWRFSLEVRALHNNHVTVWTPVTAGTCCARWPVSALADLHLHTDEFRSRHMDDCTHTLSTLAAATKAYYHCLVHYT